MGKSVGVGEPGELAETSGAHHERPDELAMVRAEVSGVRGDGVGKRREPWREDRGVVDEAPEAQGD